MVRDFWETRAADPQGPSTPMPDYLALYLLVSVELLPGSA